jgi:hypothetical protein
MRAKITALFVALILVTIFFVANSKTASACSFGSGGSEEVLVTGKYKLVNLNTDFGLAASKSPKSVYRWHYSC